ncbi:hypothetical protein EG329_005451 [Mollisiaceae sp. DMI_Dod_QoI]|nr:hypothetical protein EG329_005451 [Helotiales sp. DMI_Dod_QoI]
MSVQDPKPDPTSRHVDFTPQEGSPSSQEEGPTRKQWVAAAHRNQTNLAEVEIDSRASRHSHFLKRPRAWQYKPDGLHNSLEKATPVFRPDSRSDSQGDSDEEERSTDNPAKQLSRLDLFIDLIWVGIIANLSATFSEQAFTESGVSIRDTVLEFILLFLPIWRVWDHLRSFCINHFDDDLFQRNFVVWILILAVVFGINAPYAFVLYGGNSLKLLIGIYLAAQASFIGAYAVQAIFIPFLRRQVLFRLCATSISTGLWIAAIFVPYPGKIGLIFGATFAEYPVDVFLRSPRADRHLTPGWKLIPDIDHYAERHEGFYIIILGEGVFRLIEGSPSGLGLHQGTTTIITALLMYYALHWLYFNGDSSKKFVHALRRTWWKPVLWQFFHVVMFASLLIVATSTLFLVEHRSDPKVATDTVAAREETDEAENKPDAILNALWSASISLAVALLSMTLIALLNRPLDPPKTLLVNNRYVRLAPRLPVIITIACLPQIKDLTGTWWCGAVNWLLWTLFFWELIVGLEKDWRFIEPKG